MKLQWTELDENDSCSLLHTPWLAYVTELRAHSQFEWKIVGLDMGREVTLDKAKQAVFNCMRKFVAELLCQMDQLPQADCNERSVPSNNLEILMSYWRQSIFDHRNVIATGSLTKPWNQGYVDALCRAVEDLRRMVKGLTRL